VPAEFSLAQNYPNPFNPSTTIVYRLAGSEEVTLRVFDMLGREVAVLDAGARLAGEHTVRWNAGTAASGVYFYQLRAGSSVATHAMLLLR
jgi:hypothetical protein